MPGDIEDGFDKIFKSYIDILEEDSKASWIKRAIC
jgi:hypothetical protein